MSSAERGYYSNLGEPLLKLDLVAREQESHELTVLVDTGFNERLAVFKNDAAAANLQPTKEASEPVHLVDGSTCETSWAYGYVRWFGRLEQMRILVIHSPSEADRTRHRGRRERRCLIGMGLLHGKHLLFGEEDFEIRGPEPA